MIRNWIAARSRPRACPVCPAATPRPPPFSLSPPPPAFHHGRDVVHFVIVISDPYLVSPLPGGLFFKKTRTPLASPLSRFPLRFFLCLCLFLPPPPPFCVPHWLACSLAFSRAFSSRPFLFSTLFPATTHATTPETAPYVCMINVDPACRCKACDVVTQTAKVISTRRLVDHLIACNLVRCRPAKCPAGLHRCMAQRMFSTGTR